MSIPINLMEQPDIYRATAWLSALLKVSSRLERLATCAASTTTYGGPAIFAAFEQTLHKLCELQSALHEAETGIRELRELQGRSPTDADLGLVQAQRQRAADDNSALRTALEAAQDSGCPLFTNGSCPLDSCLMISADFIRGICGSRPRSIDYRAGPTGTPAASSAGTRATIPPDSHCRYGCRSRTIKIA